MDAKCGIRASIGRIKMSRTVEWFRLHKKALRSFWIGLICFIIISTAYWLFVPASFAPPLPLPQPITRIAMDVSACFGPCPVYSISITANHEDNGAIVFDGKSYTCAQGMHSAQISHEDLSALVDQIETADYFSYKWGYAEIVDASDVVLDIAIDGRRNRVISSYGDTMLTPGGFMDIVHALEKIADGQGWITKCTHDPWIWPPSN